MKFTLKIKREWLKALKSGKYIQLQHSFVDHISENATQHCCLAVLGEISNKGKYPICISSCTSGILIEANDIISKDFVHQQTYRFCTASY